MPWQPVYVGIGSNLEQPVQQVRRALAALGALSQTRLELTSSLYRSVPLPAGPVPQPQYVNAVAGLLTQLEVRSFLALQRELEIRLGRLPPRERWGPRLIDLDLLLFGQQSIEEPELTVPHPGIVQRNFVLYPLRDVAPELRIPGRGRVATLAARVDSAGIWRLDDCTTTQQ
jgi:2-amino-4-hydroxy-6-hydroxymethyldihydropteridine diphosphokinase